MPPHANQSPSPRRTQKDSAKLPSGRQFGSSQFSPALVTLASLHGAPRSPFPRCAGLLLPSLNVHAHDEEPQPHQSFRQEGDGQIVGGQIVCERRRRQIGQPTQTSKRQRRCHEKDRPNARRAFWFHFGTFTPFTMSHRQSDNSPIKASPRTKKIVPAKAGARMSVKLFVRYPCLLTREMEPNLRADQIGP